MSLETTTEQRQEARKILHELARSIDRKVSVEVRDVPGQDRLHVALKEGQRHHDIEVRIDEVLATADDSVARHGLKLRVKRAIDAMQFRKMPDHRVSVKSAPLPPPGNSMRGGGGRGPGRKP